jgi:hypothetical protein
MVLNKTQLARIRGFALVLIVLPYVCLAEAPQTAGGESPTCEAHQLASLDLEITDGGAVLVPVTVNRARVYMYLEIASPLTAVSEQAVERFALQRTDIGKGLEITAGGKRVYGFDKNSSGIESVADGDGHTISQYRSMELTASGLKVVDEKIKLTDPPNNTCGLAKKGDAIGYTDCLYRYPLRLGSDILQRLHVYIATKENMMYFTGNADESPIRGTK